MTPLRLLLLLFIVMPILEMWVLIEVGSLIGSMPTIGLVLLTAAVGYGLLRQQGFSTLVRGQERLQQGELPAGEIVEGLVLAVSGALLLTPGFVTDGLGFLGLIRPLRTAAVKYMLARMVGVGHASMGGAMLDDPIDGEGPRPRSSAKNKGARFRSGNTYEGEFEKEQDGTER